MFAGFTPGRLSAGVLLLLQVSQSPELTRIQLAKAFVQSDNGLLQPELLADSFQFLGKPAQLPSGRALAHAFCARLGRG